MPNEFKPCPFCGGEVSIALCGDGFDAWWFITRGHGENACKCRLFMESEKFNKDSEMADFVADDLIAAWNRRADHIRDTTKKVSNADRIRSMSDEELAREMLFFVPSDFNRHYTGIAGGYYATADEAIQANFDWLKQPANEEKE